MLGQLDDSYTVLAKREPATLGEINAAETYFGNIPREYNDLVREATEIEMRHENGQYLRIWGPSGCIEMDEGYGIRERIADAVPIGDDGGGHVLFYGKGRQGLGLYLVGYGNLDGDDAIWVADSLTELLTKAIGIDAF